MSVDPSLSPALALRQAMSLRLCADPPLCA